MDPRVAQASVSPVTDRLAILTARCRGLVTGAGSMVCVLVVFLTFLGCFEASLVVGVDARIAKNDGLAVPSSRMEAVIRAQRISGTDDDTAGESSWGSIITARVPGEIRIVVPENSSKRSVSSDAASRIDTLAFSRHERPADLPTSFWDEDSVDNWGDADDDADDAADFMRPNRSLWSFFMPGFSGPGVRAKY
ncbi:conserved hypothetical protein [Neospora caninum Liverpool]|uniref:Transmembrane protein n=1 Tax=Neospora caninum (strain Liverpool) TaxID=572307 RepID=F0VAT9_NEOCL|nr:conserved hypothetical protein [Neospora caninum Liverpool]CBZ51347.1 conserved hypothetical protein [Neospora caninum Liverpool]CEL68664.1 TPA: hypothetical protein BN1204_044120 [Neospora caninum Liverpool]|eukprot:XP_003881380.1 conserved hypothetical protein [Neospora caninum Liverpool]